MKGNPKRPDLQMPLQAIVELPIKGNGAQSLRQMHFQGHYVLGIDGYIFLSFHARSVVIKKEYQYGRICSRYISARHKIYYRIPAHPVLTIELMPPPGPLLINCTLGLKKDLYAF